MTPWRAPALENLMNLVREYGDVVPLSDFDVPFYMFNHPDQIEEILRRKHQLFKKACFLEALRPLLGDGLFTSDGESWRRHRMLAQPLFAARQIQQHAPAMVASAERMTSGWQDGETRDFHADMMHLTLELVIKTLFDVEVNDIGALGEELEAATNYYAHPRSIWTAPGNGATATNVAARHSSRQLDWLIFEMIRKRHESGVAHRKDLLSRLLLAKDYNGCKMSVAELRDQLVTHFIAGQETTALTLSYAFCLLSQNPKAEFVLHAELDRVLGGRLPTAEDTSELHYAELVIKEAMRIFPPVWAVGREALEDCEIGGNRVPKGAQLLLSQFTVHRDPRFWCDPERFNPSRWDEETTKNLPRCAYFPFGDGPRACIGANLAMMESVLLLATIVPRYRLELAQSQTLQLIPSMTLRPRDGIKMIVRQRRRTSRLKGPEPSPARTQT